MQATYSIPLETSRAEVEHLRSRFIATLGPVANSDEARAFIRKVRQEFPDASHNVPAYLIGGGKNVMDYCSDDGEPSGTAGRPVLTVLRGSGLGDCALVVTRYFGGTLLGTGGLVKAYTDAAQEVLKQVTRAKRVVVSICDVIVPYPFYERVVLVLGKNHAEVLGEAFTDQVELKFQIEISNMDTVVHAITEMTAGKTVVRVLGEDFKLIPE